MTLCAGIKADGGRCKAQAMRGSTWCIGHDPEQAEARQRRASKGGRRGGRGRPSAELVGVKAEIWEVIEAVRAEALERSTGAVVFQGYNTLLKALDTERRIRETDELARQVEELALIVDMTKNKERRA